MSELLNLREVEKRFLTERVKGRTLARGAWVYAGEPRERREVLEAYGLYRCELAMRRALLYTRTALQALAAATRAAGAVAVEARRRAGLPAPRGAPQAERLAEAAGGFEELAERMDAAYRGARDLLPRLIAGARGALTEAEKLGCLPGAAKPIASRLELAAAKENPKRNYRWWFSETGRELLAAAEATVVAYALWRGRARELEERVKPARARSSFVEEDWLRYQQVRQETLAEAQRLQGLLERLGKA
jgi:hypothetical protein